MKPRSRSLVRLPVPPCPQSVRRQAGTHLRDGRESVARGRGMAARSRTERPLLPACRRQRQSSRRKPNRQTATFTIPRNPVPTIGGPLCCDPHKLRRDRGPAAGGGASRCPGLHDFPGRGRSRGYGAGKRGDLSSRRRRSIPISQPSWWMCGRMDSPRTCRMVLCAPATGNRQPRPPS